MPITPADLAATLAPALISSGIAGLSVPQLAAGVANGVVGWTSSLVVLTVDTGTLGVGTGQLPLVVPLPLLLGSLTASLSVFSGPLAPALAAGLSNGLVQGLAQGLIQTTHPSVGVGTGIPRFIGSAVPSMVGGFASAGLVGQATLAAAIGAGLDVVLASLVIPIPIAGAPAPSPSSGTGVGKIT